MSRSGQDGDLQEMSFETWCAGDDSQKMFTLPLIRQSGHHAPLRHLKCTSSTRRPDFDFGMSEEQRTWVWDRLPEPWPDSGNNLRWKPPHIHAHLHAHIAAMTGKRRVLSVLCLN